MAIDLLKRFEKGSALSASDYDATLTTIETSLPSYTIIAGASAASISTAIQAGGVVTFAPGTYDLGALATGIVLANDLHMRALPGAEVILDMPGANQTQLPGLFALRCSNFSCKGPFRFQNGTTPFDLDTLNKAISIEIEGCEFSEVGGIIASNAVASFNTSAVIKSLKIRNNRVRNCNSGVNLRLGDGAASANYDIPLHYAEITGNDLETIDKYGLVCNYDSEAVPYPVDGVAIIARNRIVDLQGRSGSTVTGFGINPSAARRVIVTDNYLRDIQLGARTDLEPIYVKSPSGIIARNVIVDGGQNQTAIACKGGETGTEYEGLEVSNNKIIATGASVVLNGIWIQQPRIHVHDNYIYGTFNNSAIKTGGVGPYANITIENNEIILKAFNSKHGIRLDEGGANARVLNNRIVALDSASGTSHLIMIFGNDATETYPELLIRGNHLHAEAAVAGTCHGITFQISGGASVTDPRVQDNRCIGTDSAVNIVTDAVSGKVYLRDNDATGLATAIVDTPGTTQFDSRFDRGFVGLPAARTVYAIVAGTNVNTSVDVATGQITVNFVP